MVFVDKGEANSAVSTFTSMQKGAMDQSGKLLNELLEILRKIEKGEKLNEQEQKDLDKTCAEMVASATREYGQLIKTEEGKEVSCYIAEKYTVIADLDDSAGMPIYQVYNHTEPGMVMSFQLHPKTGEPVFFEVENPLSNEEKAEFIKTLERQAKREDRKAEPKGIELVKQRQENMGDMAPLGTKAILVAHAVLEEEGKNKVRGNSYEFQKGKNGEISVFYVGGREPRLIAEMSPAGNVTGHISGDVVEKFSAMFQKLQDARSHSTPLKSAAKEMEIGSR
jgi:hypothetical protein